MLTFTQPNQTASPEPEHRSPANREPATGDPATPPPWPELRATSQPQQHRPRADRLPEIPPVRHPEEERSRLAYQSSCSPVETPAAASPGAESFGSDSTTIKIAMAAPESSHFVQRLREAASLIAESTAGRVQIKFFPGGIQGPNNLVLKKIKIGRLHGAIFAPGDLHVIYPALVIYELPLLFRSEDEIAFVRTRIDSLLLQGLGDAGFVSFCFAGRGFSMLMSRSPIANIVDLRARRVWSPEGNPISDRFFRTLGVHTAVLPLTDVFFGLQTELLDTISATPVAALLFQWRTKLGYISDLPLAYEYSLLAIDAKIMNRLSPDDRRVVTAVLTNVYLEFDKAGFTESNDVLDALIDQGMQLVSPHPSFRPELEDHVRDEYLRMARDGLFPEELYLRITEILAEYRAREAR